MVGAVGLALPKGMLRNSARESGVEQDGPPAWVREYEATIEPTTRDLEINQRYMNGVMLGVSTTELFVAARTWTGKPKELLRREPLDQCRIGWLDHEERRLHTRFFHVDFPDGKWMFLSNGWNKDVSEDAPAIVEAAGDAAYVLHDLATRRDAAG